MITLGDLKSKFSHEMYIPIELTKKIKFHCDSNTTIWNVINYYIDYINDPDLMIILTCKKEDEFHVSQLAKELDTLYELED